MWCRVLVLVGFRASSFAFGFGLAYEPYRGSVLCEGMPVEIGVAALGCRVHLRSVSWPVPVGRFVHMSALAAKDRPAAGRSNIGALIITYTILGVLYVYSTMGPKTLFKL